MRAARLTGSLAAVVMAVAMVAGPGAAAWARSAQAGPGSIQWTSLHDGSAGRVAVSPDGRQVFVVGTDSGDFATVAYDAATGQQAWEASYSGTASGHDLAGNVAVSPGGQVVYVTGTDASHYATVAYAADTGQQLWASRVASRAGTPGALAVSPDGGTVYVTGTSRHDYGTVAYAAASGKELWASQYNGRAGRNDFGYALAVSKDGTRVYVTGASQGRSSGSDAATVAYNAATGKQVWASRYNGHASGNDSADSVAVSLDGHRVFVTGTSQGVRSHNDIFTAAYAAASGKSLWVRRYNGHANLDDTGGPVLVSPLGGTVIAFGTSRQQADSYTAIAYNTVTGATRWTGTFTGADHRSTLADAAFSPDGSTVYMTGTAVVLFDGGGINTYAFTAAVSATTGAELWGTLASKADGVNSYGSSLAVSPDGGTVYTSYNTFSGASTFTTLALQG